MKSNYSINAWRRGCCEYEYKCEQVIDLPNWREHESFDERAITLPTSMDSKP